MHGCLVSGGANVSAPGGREALQGSCKAHLIVSGAQLWMQGIIYLEVLSFFPVTIRGFDICECDESYPRHALMSLSNLYFLLKAAFSK